MIRAAATYLDRAGAWREGTLLANGDKIGLSATLPAADLPRLDGVITGGFSDAHVHLSLIDTAGLATARLGRVLDLGSDPETLPHTSREVRRARLHGVEIEFAGVFLTPPGGYPSDRAWAPEGSVREIADAPSAASTIAEMTDLGATCIKVADNAEAGPVFTDDLFRRIVDIAEAAGLPVVAHAEGAGQAQRATRLGARVLAHAPFSERLSDAEIAEQASRVSWISTLAIHNDDAARIAIDNVRRFFAAGGDVRYGTDMGNGPTPVDLNETEVQALRAAGIAGDALLRALAPVDPLVPGTALLLHPSTAADLDPLRATRLIPADLEGLS